MNTTINKEDLTLSTFFDQEEIALVESLLRSQAYRVSQAKGLIDQYLEKLTKQDTPMKDFLNPKIAENLFQEINIRCRITKNPDRKAELQDMAWKIQDYVY